MSEYDNSTKIRMNVFSKYNQEDMQAVVEMKYNSPISNRVLTMDDIVPLLKIGLGVILMEQSDGNTRYMDCDKNAVISIKLQELKKFIDFRGKKTIDFLDVV